MRAVLDPNVLISALLSPRGAPAQIVSQWRAGAFELVVADLVVVELERALGYPKLRDRVSPEEVAELVELLRAASHLADDPVVIPRRSPDAGDDYLLALAEAERAILVSGDRHILGLADTFPIRTPTEFLAMLGDEPTV